MMDLAARYAKEWNCFYKSVEEVVQLQADMDGVCRSVGRDPADLARSLMTPLVIGRDEGGFARCIDRHREVFSGLPTTPEEWRASGFLGGTVEEVRLQVERLTSAGVQRLIFEFNDVDDVHALELVADELPSIDT